MPRTRDGGKRAQVLATGSRGGARSQVPRLGGKREARDVSLQLIHLERWDLVSEEDVKRETSPDLESSLFEAEETTKPSGQLRQSRIRPVYQPG